MTKNSLSAQLRWKGMIAKLLRTNDERPEPIVDANLNFAIMTKFSVCSFTIKSLYCTWLSSAIPCWHISRPHTDWWGLNKIWCMIKITSYILYFAGTSQSTSIYGSVVFNLTFLNEVTRSNGTPYHLYANVIDSCIEIIVCRPVIREHHLIQKIPQYFDETTLANRRRQWHFRRWYKEMRKKLRLLVYDKEALLHPIVVGDPMSMH